MRNLTQRELKAVEKVQTKFDFFKLTQATGCLSNGQILNLIRYCKGLNLRRKCHED